MAYLAITLTVVRVLLLFLFHEKVEVVKLRLVVDLFECVELSVERLSFRKYLDVVISFQ